MAGKQAKILSSDAFNSLLAYASSSRHPVRNAVIVLLSVKAGLRAGEIANLTWPMVLDADGEVRTDYRAARQGGQERLRPVDTDSPGVGRGPECMGRPIGCDGYVIKSERGGP